MWYVACAVFDIMPNINQQARCEFNRTGLNNVWSVHHAHALKVVICNKGFRNSVDEAMLACVFFEALKLTVPLAGSQGFEEQQTPWLFDSHKGDVRVQWLMAPMNGSVLYSDKAQAKKKAKKETYSHKTPLPPITIQQSLSSPFRVANISSVVVVAAFHLCHMTTNSVHISLIFRSPRRPRRRAVPGHPSRRSVQPFSRGLKK
jgi:hypothetical protein